MAELTLDQVLSGEDLPQEEPKGEAAEETAEATEETTEDTTEEETTQEAEPEETEAKDDEPPASDKPGQVPIQALLDEREKRQEAQRRAKELEKQLADAQPKEAIDPLQDPEGFSASVQDQIRAATLSTEIKFMRMMHDDFDDAWEWANQEIGSNAAMQAKLQGSENAVQDIYAMYQQHQTLEQLGDVDALRAKIEAEVRAELAQEAAPKDETEKPKAPNKPSLASTPTTKATADPGNLTLEDTIGLDFRNRPK